ncbi:MAG: type IV secretion system DNA-binding domain-containing protein [Candidatus Nomurabacteria bacterium]
MSEINDPNKITYLASIDHRNKMIKFGIKAKDRTKHTYIIGKSGMGKSTLLENMVIQDIQNGEGVAFMDPHGGSAEMILHFVPEERKKDVIYFAPFDTEFPIALNILEKVDISKRHLVANGLMAAFKKIFGEDKFSDRMQYILNNIILSLLENDNETLLGINRMLSDKEYRKKIIENVKDPSIRSFWLEEFAKAGEKYQQEAAPGIQNKIGQFTSNPLIRNIIGQKRTSFDIRDIMDNKKILIINLSKGKMGEGNANLIGSLLITKIYLAAMGRADVDHSELKNLPPFYFYVDEFQNFANESFADILSEARKYQLALTVAHQYTEQMTDEVRAAIFGNVGTMITFRVGATDAEIFEKEFAPVFTADDIVNLSAYQVYLRLMIDNVGSKPFSAKCLPPIEKPQISYAEEIIELSRHAYGKSKDIVEQEVQDWYTPPQKNEPKTEIVHNYVVSTTPVERKNENNYYGFQQNNNQNPNSFQSKGHVRSRHDNFKKERDIKDVNLSEVRKEVEKVKTEGTVQNTSLKDALAKAMNEEKNRKEISSSDNKVINTIAVEKVENKIENNEEKKQQNFIKENFKSGSEIDKKLEEKIEQEKREIKEISEKVLRDLVEE